ncbi:MAG: glutamate-5-semialdehyde dehydrogenase [SAR92 bacterium MED-G29]|nr:MAG: glutamate-5-semialdehyde dehydrogenase [SAR92 bacterium MED-G29]
MINAPKKIDYQSSIKLMGKAAREASLALSSISSVKKNQALLEIAKSLDKHRQTILSANLLDMELARSNKLETTLLDRLELNNTRIDTMIEGLKQVTELPDPIGETSDLETRPNGLRVGKMRVPIGVVGIIYESRPNVTIDSAALCLKSGNACILRGGSESIQTNRAMGMCIKNGLAETGLPSSVIQVINEIDRAIVGELITMSDYIDVIIPRGGKSLIERLIQDSRIPMIKHLEGNCHVFIDKDADHQKAINIALNSKTHRYGVCNAMETLLIAQSIAPKILPKLAMKFSEKGVELRGCNQSKKIVGNLILATESDWFEEYLGPTLAIKLVLDVDEAIEHINKYGSKHTDSIVSENISTTQKFMMEVDSSSVMTNTSTRFADGFEYGLGAEIGISTDKIHARGPVGLLGLTTEKWIVFGDGHVRQ